MFYHSTPPVLSSLRMLRSITDEHPLLPPLLSLPSFFFSDMTSDHDIRLPSATGFKSDKRYVVMASVNQHASFHQAAGGRDNETHDEQAT